MENDQPVLYRIDAEDRIVFVNESWEKFSDLNAASRYSAESILNRSLWTLIRDRTTQAIYREILQKVRANFSMTFNLRCDSPDCRRFLQMTISNHPDEVQFEIRPVKIEARLSQRILEDESPRSEDMIIVCSWCKKFRLDENDWQEVETAVISLGLFEKEEFPLLSHGICLDCYESMSVKIGQAGRS